MPRDDDSQSMALVAEDEALIRMEAVQILEDAGFTALEAGHADEALDLLSAHAGEVDLLFTDVDMPGGSRDGFALAKETARLYPDISVLVASGRRAPGPDDMPDGARFVGKPFSAEIVRTRLKEILPEHRKPDPLRS